MKTLFEQRLESIKTLVKANKAEELRAFLEHQKKQFLLITPDNKNLNVMHHLAKAGEEAVCEFLLLNFHDFYATPMDCALGAALGGNKALADRFLDKIPNQSKHIYNKVATFAEKGGYKALAAQYRALGIQQEQISRIEMIRQARISWFENTLKFKQINAFNGIDNCAYCAFRLDDYIRNNHADAVVDPVPVGSANLVTLNRFANSEIQRKSTEDERVLTRCYFSITNSVVYDISDDETDDPVLEIIEDKNDKAASRKKRVWLNRVNTRNQDLNERLKQQARRESDEACFGLVFLTESNLKIGHVLNYYVDKDNEVYFVDAGNRTITSRLDLTGYVKEVFYIQSLPKEGFKVKKEKEIEAPSITVQKRDEALKTPFEVFVESFKALVKARDESGLKTLLETKTFSLSTADCKGLNALHYLARDAQEEDCEFLLNRFCAYGVTPHSLAIGAAIAGKEAMANRFLAKINDALEYDFNKLAAGAAGGGHQDLADRFIERITNISKRNYNLVAAFAALSGHETIANRYLEMVPVTDTSKPLYNYVAAAAAQGGDEAMANRFLERITNVSMRKYNQVAANAAFGGHEAMADRFLEKIADISKRDYSLLEKFAAKSGYTVLAAKYRALAQQQAQLVKTDAANAAVLATTSSPLLLSKVLKASSNDENASANATNIAATNVAATHVDAHYKSQIVNGI